MPQYDVYELGRRASGKSFIVVLQHDGMYDLGTTFVAPLVPSNYFKHPFPVINPVVTIDEKDYIIRMEQMAAIAAKRLKEPVANISDKSYDITKALDRLFSGI